MTHCHLLIDRLRRRGFRITPQREMIVEALAHSDKHMTAEEIYAKVKDRSPVINLATIYRTLDMLVAEGMASRSDFLNSKVVYAANYHGGHLHLVCRHCGTVMEAEQDLLDPVEETLEQQYQFTGDFDHLTIMGLCSDCRRRNLFLEA